MKNKNILGHLQIIMSSSLFGLMPLFTKMAYSYGATPITVAFCRCFYATIILALMLPIMKKNEKPAPQLKKLWHAPQPVFADCFFPSRFTAV